MDFDKYIRDLNSNAEKTAIRADMFRKMKEDISKIPYEWLNNRTIYSCELVSSVSGHLLNDAYYNELERARVSDYYRMVASTFTDHVTEKLLNRSPEFASNYLTGIDRVPDVYAAMFDDLLFGKHAEHLPPSQPRETTNRRQSAAVHLAHFFGKVTDDENSNKFVGQFLIFSGTTERRADGLIYIKKKLDQRHFGSN